MSAYDPKSGLTENVSVVPTGVLKELTINQIKPSPGNPRQLFDEGPLKDLKESILQHGVLVPITVFKLSGQDRYGILDGERRYRCCVEIFEENEVEVKIPANVVAPPTKIAGLLYMFSIHNFREQWELMPTAIGLRTIIKELKIDDNEKLSHLTGLSSSQVERCKKLLSFPEKYTSLSLDPDPKTRIPSNFWIESLPVIDLVEEELPDLAARIGRDGIIDRLIDKYRKGKITSVIHFRRIMEAYGVAEDRRKEVLEILTNYVMDPELETRAAFDQFIADNRRVVSVISSAEDFIRKLERAQLEYVSEREKLIPALENVMSIVKSILLKLEGEDPPNIVLEEDSDN